MSIINRFGPKPLCSLDKIPINVQWSRSQRAMIPFSFLLGILMMAPFYCCGISHPFQKADNDLQQSLLQGGLSFRVIFNRELNGDSIRPNSHSVSQRADSIDQLLHHGLDSQRRVYEPLVEVFRNVRVKLRRLDAREGVVPPNPSVAHDFNVFTYVRPHL